MTGSDRRSGRTPSIPLDELVARGKQQTEQNEYDAEVNTILQEALREFNNRDVEQINQHIDTVREAVEKDIEGHVFLRFGGSVAKHTYLNGLSDIDLLVCVNDSNYRGKNPTEVLGLFAALLRQRLPKTEIKVGDLAVTVKFSDGHTIQLLPSIRTETGFRIANPSTQSWSRVVSPERFAHKLTEVNRNQSNMVVPVIKLAKAINESLPKDQRLSGYHIESLAIEAFERYQGSRTYKEMLRHYLVEARHRVLRPINDNSGQSVHVDDYLGDKDSQARQRASKTINNIIERIDRANNLRSTDFWEGVYD